MTRVKGEAAPPEVLRNQRKAEGEKVAGTQRGRAGCEDFGKRKIFEQLGKRLDRRRGGVQNTGI